MVCVYGIHSDVRIPADRKPYSAEVVLHVHIAIDDDDDDDDNDDDDDDDDDDLFIIL